MLAFTQLVLGLTLCANLGILVIVLRAHQRSLLRRVFALYIVGITAWALMIFINLWLGSIFVESCIFASAAFLLTAQFWFVKLFPEERLPDRWYGYWSIVPGVFFFVLSFIPGTLFHTISVLPNGYTVLDTGALSTPYSLFALLYVVTPAIMLFRKYKGAKHNVLRQQLRYLLFGFSVFVLVNILTNSVLPIFFHVFFFNAIGPVFSLVLAAFVLYIITHHQFLDIRLIIQRGLIYTVLLSIVSGCYVLLITLSGYALRELTDSAIILSAGMTMLFGVFSMPMIERYFRRLTDPWFFKDTYDYANATHELTQILNRNVDPDVIVDESTAALLRILKAEHMTFLFLEHAPPEHLRMIRKLWSKPGGVARFERAIMVNREQYAAALTDSPGMSDRQMLADTLGSAYAARIIVPITLEAKLLGALFVGAKRSGDDYTPQDISLLEDFSSQIAVAYEKALLYAEVARHSATLEHKVAERTKEIAILREREQEMITDISHGLQTPLTIVKGAIGELRKQLTDTAQLESFERSIDMVSKFIYDLLSLARLDDKGACCDDTVDVTELLTELAEYVEVSAGEKGIRIVTMITPSLSVKGNKDRLTEAVVNLLSNAMKYIGNKKEHTITINAERSGGHVLIVISDTGIGIPDRDLPHLFERFYRVKRTGLSEELKGTGLGLAIVKRIVLLHKGTIRVESIRDKGTTFTMTLPALPQ